MVTQKRAKALPLFRLMPLACKHVRVHTLQAFPNPFSRIKTVIGQDQWAVRGAMNWLSYYAVDDIQW